jgi:hypothetical protein
MARGGRVPRPICAPRACLLSPAHDLRSEDPANYPPGVTPPDETPARAGTTRTLPIFHAG